MKGWVIFKKRKLHKNPDLKNSKGLVDLHPCHGNSRLSGVVTPASVRGLAQMREGQGEDLRLPEPAGLMPICLSFSICTMGMEAKPLHMAWGVIH